MKKFNYFLIFLFLLACKPKEYKYKIEGQVYIPTSGLNPMHDAIWFTDSIRFRNDTIFYTSSDGSVVQINPPYKIYKLK